MSKLRSRLTSAYHEALTLANFMLERSLKEKKLDKILALEQHMKLHGCMDPCGAAEALYGEESAAVTAQRRSHRHRHRRGARRLRYPPPPTAAPHCIEDTGYRLPPDLPPTLVTVK